jgi:predicted kinase
MTPALLIVCRAMPATVRQRLEQRRDDVSDADWEVYMKAAADWEACQASVKHLVELSTDGDVQTALAAALAELRMRELC